MKIKEVYLTESSSMTIYSRFIVQDNCSKLPTVIVCPGGGYEFLSEREGEIYAFEFLANNFNVVELKYNLINRNNPQQSDIDDALRDFYICIDEIVKYSDQYQLDINNLILCGSSAGGHLVSRFANELEKIRKDVKIRSTILCYPVTSFDNGWSPTQSIKEMKITDLDKYNNVKNINEFTPPSFVWHTVTDELVPVSNTIDYISGLNKKNIPYECHLYGHGGHGLALGTFSSNNERNIILETWFGLAIDFVNRNLSDK